MNKQHIHMIDIITKVLVLIGALNWGLIGLFDWDLVSSIFGEMEPITRIIYTAVGLSAVYKIIGWARHEMGK